MAPWLIGLMMSVGCILLHAAGMGALAMAADNQHFTLDPSRDRHLKRIAKLMFLITAVCVALGFLHMVESILWAFLFTYVGAIGNYSDALFYSFDTMSTRGAPGITLQHQWRSLGAVEACAGMLLVGMSTAFLFALFQQQARTARRTRHPAPSQSPTGF